MVPWIAQSLSKAFHQAQEIAYRDFDDSGALSPCFRGSPSMSKKRAL
jgi:hypothetical protein